MKGKKPPRWVTILNMTEYHGVGLRLKLVRLLLGASIEHIAGVCGVTSGMIRNWESNKMAPSLYRLRKWCKALNVNMSLILGSELRLQAMNDWEEPKDKDAYKETKEDEIIGDEYEYEDEE